MESVKHLSCTTPRCLARVGEGGGSRVVEFHRKNPADAARCEGCGGIFNTDIRQWIHECSLCGVAVEPGALTGLFVPHRCEPCDQKVVEQDRKTGNICRLCGTVRSWCCC